MHTSGNVEVHSVNVLADTVSVCTKMVCVKQSSLTSLCEQISMMYIHLVMSRYIASLYNTGN